MLPASVASAGADGADEVIVRRATFYDPSRWFHRLPVGEGAAGMRVDRRDKVLLSRFPW